MGADGAITGKPQNADTPFTTFRVQDSTIPNQQSVTKTLQFKITAAPAALSIMSLRTLPLGTATVLYSTVLTAVGGTGPGTYTWTLAGDSVDTLPTALTLAADGTLSGTPDPGTARTYSLKFTVTDTTPQSVSDIFTLIIN